MTVKQSDLDLSLSEPTLQIVISRIIILRFSDRKWILLYVDYSEKCSYLDWMILSLNLFNAFENVKLHFFNEYLKIYIYIRK